VIVRLFLAALALVSLPSGSRAQERITRPGADAPDLNEDGQSTRLPPLSQGMTVAMIQQGDALFRGKGGCVTCHGPDGGGMPASGSAITAGLNFIPSSWEAIDALIKAGAPEPLTRTPIAMPPRGAQSNLTDEETRLIAAYVWAISQVKGEPWPGGHRSHGAASAN
jgi:mono/diheme cytochrome c family protein